jgi:hypothetical protein
MVLGFSAAARAQAPRGYDVAVAQIYPRPIELTDEVRTASRRDALFVQPAGIRDVVRLQAPVEAAETGGQGNRTISRPAARSFIGSPCGFVLKRAPIAQLKC